MILKGQFPDKGAAVQWRNTALDFAELAFETDHRGRIVWIGTHSEEGLAATGVIGEMVEALISTATADPAQNPFLGKQPPRGHTILLPNAASGAPHRRMLVTTQRVADETGRETGLRGMAIAVQEPAPVAAEWHWRLHPATGLLTSIGLFDDILRRTERLDHEGKPGTLLLIEMEALSTDQTTLTPHMESEAVLSIVELLRAIFRPTDLLGQISERIFAIWMDGADHLTAAERAEALRRHAEPLLIDAIAAPLQPGQPLITQAITTRPAGSTETVAALLARARQTLEQVHRQRPGNWRVSLQTTENHG
jgi:GGDEF domain-containing protein